MPLDPDGEQGESLGIHVRVRAGEGDGVPVVALAGGPGQSASALTRTFEAMLDPVIGSRPLVLFDRRGTGRSGLLTCPALQRAGARMERSGPVAKRVAGRATGIAAARCAARLGDRRRHYLTDDVVRDLEAVRAHLGAEQLVLYAASFGSRAALAYAGRYPERVERLVLDSPVPLAGPDPLMRSTLAAIPRLLRSKCGAMCASDPVGDLAALVARLRTGGNARRGQARDPAAWLRAGLLDVLLAGEQEPMLRARFPRAVRAALDGDGRPIRDLVDRAKRVSGGLVRPDLFSAALNATVVCEELALPWPKGASPKERLRAVHRALAALPSPVVYPFDRATLRHSSVLELCRRWPHLQPPVLSSGLSPRTGAPTLVIAGREDLLTPLADSRRLAHRLPAGRLLPVSGVGHTVLARVGPRSCAVRRTLQFLDPGSRRRVCAPR